MSLTINLIDISPEGLSIECEVESSAIALSSDDGNILGSLYCVGQVFAPNHHLANFQGVVTGKIIRECVRCLKSFEEDVSLHWDAGFRKTNQSSGAAVFSKKMKKGSRRYDSAIDDELEEEIDTYPITENQIDLLPALREHLILATPLQPLCQQECAGLCQLCGANLNEGVCGCCSPVTLSSAFVSDVHPVLSQKTAKQSSRPV